MSLRDRPRALDWLGVGLRALGLAIKVRAEHRAGATGNPWTYFEGEGVDPRWIEIPCDLRELVLEHAADVEVAQDYWDGQPDSARVCFGRIGDEHVGWVEDGEDILDGPYLLAARADETYRAIGGRIWRRVGTVHCAYDRGGLTDDPFRADAGVVPTAQLRELESRVRAFLRSGVGRSYLFVGPPGTGKSAGVRHLVRALELRSLRVDVAALSTAHSGGDTRVVANLDALLRLLEPHALILDDIDRVDIGGELLHFLELAARTCRVVLATANCTDAMLGAALRPGRFDEVVRVDRLDPDVLEHMLGHDADLADRLRDLPVAYVADFVKRRRVLGRARSLAELDELIARRKQVDQATRDGR